MKPQRGGAGTEAIDECQVAVPKPGRFSMQPAEVINPLRNRFWAF